MEEIKKVPERTLEKSLITSKLDEMDSEIICEIINILKKYELPIRKTQNILDTCKDIILDCKTSNNLEIQPKKFRLTLGDLVIAEKIIL